jgi:hypothetical protein
MRYDLVPERLSGESAIAPKLGRIAKCGRNTICGGRICVSVERGLKR